MARYWQHEREKKLAEIQLPLLSHELEECRVEHEYSETRGARKRWEAHRQKVVAGRALGRPNWHINFSSAESPDEAAYQRPQQAPRKYKELKDRLNTIGTKDEDYTRATQLLQKLDPTAQSLARKQR